MALTSPSDYQKGLMISKNDITYLTRNVMRYKTEYDFRIKSASANHYYFVNIILNSDSSINTYCSCPKYDRDESCKHVAACLSYYAKFFFPERTDDEKLSFSKEILSIFLEKANQRHIKEEVKLEYGFELRSHYFGTNIVLHMKIGTEKKYSLNHKIKNFLEAYQNNKLYKFGKEFTYDPEKHFFSERTMSVLNLLGSMIYNMRCNDLYLNSHEIKTFLSLIRHDMIRINGIEVKGFEEVSPYDISLKKDGTHYSFRVNIKGDAIISLTSDQEFTFLNGIIYHMPFKVSSLIQKMHDKGMDELLFEESDLHTFSKSILPLVKNEIVLDSSVSDISIGTTPEVKIYLDFLNSGISAQVMFQYKDEEINYFDSQNIKVLRDSEFEKGVLEQLMAYHFEVKKKHILLSDVDEIGLFLEEGLEALSHQFEVFTSEKIKNTNLYKNSKFTTTFSIGKDNIMKLGFQFDHIADEDLEGILVSLKQKKKYFKLKSGDILSLENKELNEFQDLMDELEMSYEELIQNGGELPKYYALYLDSLKGKKYHIIKTNHQFNQFITKFKKYQNVELFFTPEEMNLLRNYQIDGVKWLYTLYKCGFGGILADEMGLGKSLQTIVFFQKILKEKKHSKFLIVAPTSLLYNWKNEFLKFAPEISVVILSNQKKVREKILQNFSETVFITSYGLLREDEELYLGKEFEVCVIDEAQNIKNPKAGISKATKKIISNMKLALTGTPLENSVIELWSIFDFIMPGYLSNLTRFQEKYRIHDFDEKANLLLEKLKQQITPFLLRRKKLDVAKDLPDKIINTIYIDLSERERKIYAAEVKNVQKKMEEKIEREGFLKARFEILKLITRLRQLCISPKILYESFPFESAKLENLQKVITGVVQNGHKVLLFTSFRTALDLVRNELNYHKISNYTIDGSVSSKKRMELVDQFNKDDTKVFLIMLKSGGTGLNLTSADVVIHLDLWWNPQAENQATDRTHRIGQTKTVEVIKLVTKGTIEEKILELQEKKQLLSNKLIESNGVDTEILKKLTEEDIRHLLSYENR